MSGLAGLAWSIFDSWLSGLLVTDESEGKVLGEAENGALATLFLDAEITIVYYRLCKRGHEGCRINFIASIATP